MYTDVSEMCVPVRNGSFAMRTSPSAKSLPHFSMPVFTVSGIAPRNTVTPGASAQSSPSAETSPSPKSCTS
jgi:hypothetical protein